MSYQVLARKWRPRSFAEMVGQAHVVRALSNALDNDRLHHAYLFTGTRGVGKTTLARILSKSLNCETGVGSQPCGECGACREIDDGRFVDLLEIDAASKTGVDDTRELLDNVPYAPVRGRYKVYLIDEVHMFSGHSFNALLKTLEEPPPHVKFLLATTDPQKVPVTVLSRCLQFNLKRLPLARIEQQLAHILDAESVTYEPPALRELARAADGSMRDGLSLLDQAIAFGGGSVRQQDVRAMLGVVSTERLPPVLRAAHAGRGAAVIEEIDAMAAHAPDFGGLLRELVAMLHRVALLQQVPDAAGEAWSAVEELRDLADTVPPEDIQLYYQIALNGQRDLPLAPDERSGFEMVLLRMLAFRPDRAPRAPAGGGGDRRASETAGSNAAAPPPESIATADVAVPRAAADVVPDARARFGDWDAFVRDLGVAGMTAQLAGNAVPGRWDGKTLTLHVDAACSSLIGSVAQTRLQQAVADALGTDVVLRLEARPEIAGTPARRAEHAARQRQAETEAEIASDPIVLAMQDQFDAEIVTGSIRRVEQPEPSREDSV